MGRRFRPPPLAVVAAEIREENRRNKRGLKANLYYCTGCKNDIHRQSGKKSIVSFCSSVGKYVRMRRVKRKPNGR